MSAQRRVCPRGTKSLCQKQLLILLSKVRLCGGRPARPDRGPGEWLGRGRSAWEVEAKNSGMLRKSERGWVGTKSRPGFPFLCPSPRVSLLPRARGKLEGLSSFTSAARPHPRGWSPHPHRPPPTCRLSAILSVPSRGARGSGRLGHPEGFCGSGIPAPAPLLQLLLAWTRCLPTEPAWLASSLPTQLSPECPCQNAPLCALLPRPAELSSPHYSLHDSKIGSQKRRGPTAPRNSDTVDLGEGGCRSTYKGG